MRLGRNLGLKCPHCSALVPSAHRWGTPFECPGCGRQWQLSRRYYDVVGWLDVALGACFALALGCRGWQLLWGIPAGFIAATVVVTELRFRFFPPALEPWCSEDRHWG